MPFTWNDVQKTAKKDGQLVYAMRQSQTDVMTMPGPWGNAYSGFCNGLAIKWLALRASSLDFDFDVKTKECDFPHWHATREQNIYEDADDSVALAKQDLKLAGGKAKRSGPPDAEWMTNQIAAQSGLYLVGFFRDGGGHGVAMESSVAPGLYRYFDANFGHFLVKGKSSFEAWLDTFLKASGYGNRYLQRTEIDRVEPKGTVSVKALRARFGG